ncbi:MAG: hypothetical protein ACKOQ4_08400 [Mycobacterium sp.]
MRRALTALAAAILLVVSALLFRDATTRRTAEQAGAAALDVARDSIPAILSYQPGTAEQDLTTAARDRLTGRFLEDYTQLIATVVVPDAIRKGVAASATVPAAAVVSASAEHAVVLAYVDQTTTEGDQPPVRSNSGVRVSMDRVDGRWLISGFEPI